MLAELVDEPCCRRCALEADGEEPMITRRQVARCSAAAISIMVGLGLSLAGAQSNADTAAVMAANEAFYAALSKLDFAAMDKVYPTCFMLVRSTDL
jgi:hypothetical protein